jgi:hypothetical protein
MMKKKGYMFPFFFVCVVVVVASQQLIKKLSNMNKIRTQSV